MNYLLGRPQSLHLSGSALKVIAVSSMIVDHWAYFFVQDPNQNYIMRSLGRVAFPLFAFLIAEGFGYTRNRTRYFLTLLLLAVISEVPWYLLFENDGSHNVMFTLSLGVVALGMFDNLRQHPLIYTVGMLLCALGASYLGCDFGWRGVLVVIIFYVFQRHNLEDWFDVGINYREQAFVQILFAFPLMAHFGPLGAAFASLLIVMYDETRGFIKGKFWKYCFYAIYPTHFFLFYVLL